MTELVQRGLSVLADAKTDWLLALEVLLALSRKASNEQLEAAQEVIAAQDDLLVAYRLGGDPVRADKALTRLAAARASFPAKRQEASDV